MNDADIIKALECCLNCGDCDNCIYSDVKCIDMTKDALDLINRQKVEIERWETEYKRVCAERDAHICTNNFVRNEAIKELAERLKVHSFLPLGTWMAEKVVTEKHIDSLVKEMTEGADNDSN